MVWLVVPVFIVLGLAAYAGWLLWQLRQHQQRLAAQEAQAAARQAEHETWLAESIRIIAYNMLHKDLNLSEGVLRLRALLTALGVEGEQRAPYLVIDELAAEVDQFATHEARKALPAQARLHEDRAREAHERAYRERVLAAVEPLQHFAQTDKINY